ncbi:arsenate reductase ArsC [Microbulbifer bruguierae]|uniref:Arsenate reductase ArsC n=1 Tax=Microbulbifer bruguierae TaxID=3029061 RepID=A0ABY8NEN1_9GAMM|nr:arsenate reductase ArsC [Microbulbifer bruguierae]WGL17140.1 arsenate reductase ArsC [Microbulbifer bruguierae]
MKILYICTHNRCRSILSEAVTNQLGRGLLEARSAGSQPSGEVHPLSLKYLQGRNISIDGLHSKSWDSFENWVPDAVITVCDSAAGESCPIWLGDTPKFHWGLKDPSKLQGSESEMAAAFNETIDIIEDRVAQMLTAGVDRKRGEDLRQVLQQLVKEY